MSELVARVRSIRPDVGLSLFCLCSASDDPKSRAVRESMGNGFPRRFFGSPEEVAAGLSSLADLGFDRANVSPVTDASFELLAPHLFA